MGNQATFTYDFIQLIVHVIKRLALVWRTQWNPWSSNTFI